MGMKSETWQELRDSLVDAGIMKPFYVTQTYSGDFSNVDWDFKEAREQKYKILEKMYGRINGRKFG